LKNLFDQKWLDDAVVIALGCSLAGPYPSREALLDAAIEALTAEGLKVAARSAWWTSAAWPDPNEPSSFSTDFDEAFLEKVRERAAHRAPFLKHARIVREKCRAGLYENTPDHHAILGPSPIEGLYLATGFSGHGVMHSPATGRALSEYILDGKVTFMDVSQLYFERFAKCELLHETSFI